jgi:hypothetical protein
MSSNKFEMYRFTIGFSSLQLGDNCFNGILHMTWNYGQANTASLQLETVYLLLGHWV